MPAADVVVIGAGLAGLSCAVELAERGASVFVAAKGMAATHWAHGGLDVAAPPGARTAAAGIALLARQPEHPYARLADDVAPAVAAHLDRLASAGLPHVGALADPLVSMPTAVGTHRPAAILPLAQAAARDEWGDIGLLHVGFERYRDAWPAYAARNALRRPFPGAPARIAAVEVSLPGLRDLHNLNALTLARSFDQPAWRARALRAIAAARPPGRWRLALPAVLGLVDHAAAFAEAAALLDGPPIELVSVPPSVPGLRLWEALRSRLLALGGRLQWGFPIVGVERDGDRITAVRTEGASRAFRLVGDAFVLATGGIAGGGLRAAPDGSIAERVFGLPVSAPPREAWFAGDALAAQPIEAAGILTDEALHPVGGPRNVHVIGSALAGMRYLDERCGDGVALASAHRAARLLGRAGAAASVREEGVA